LNTIKDISTVDEIENRKMKRRRDIFLTQFVGYKKAVLNGTAATRLKVAGACWRSFKTKIGVYSKEKIRETHLKGPQAPVDY
jgi:hypothetical protein